jgi:ABC-2 type transport system permease protein
MKNNCYKFYGVYTLYIKEVKRFIKVYNQTIFAPTVSALTFFSIFVLALGGGGIVKIHGIHFASFIAYGLIIMSMVQNAFSNTSSSITMSKVLGYISDILIPPFSPLEIICAYILAAITRALLVGLTVTVILYQFIDIHVYSYPVLIISTILATTLLGTLGMMTGIIANNFDQNASINSYIITPLSFLSGTFYSIDRLPVWLQYVSKCNPFFYMIDIFRYSLTGYTDSLNITFGISYLTIITIIALYSVNVMLKNGWRIKN